MLDFRRTQMKMGNGYHTVGKSKLGYVAFTGGGEDRFQIWIKPMSNDKKALFQLETHKQLSDYKIENGRSVQPVYETKEYGIYKTSKEAIAEANRLFKIEG